MHRLLILVAFAASCSNHDNGAASCDNMRNSANDALWQFVSANLHCTKDSDCVIGPTLASCFNKGECPYAINRAGAVDAGVYSTELCAPMQSEGCGPSGGWQGCLSCPGPVCNVDAGVCKCNN